MAVDRVQRWIEVELVERTQPRRYLPRDGRQCPSESVSKVPEDTQIGCLTALLDIPQPIEKQRNQLRTPLIGVDHVADRPKAESRASAGCGGVRGQELMGADMLLRQHCDTGYRLTR